jgi:hypothetical protein
MAAGVCASVIHLSPVLIGLVIGCLYRNVNSSLIFVLFSTRHLEMLTFSLPVRKINFISIHSIGSKLLSLYTQMQLTLITLLKLSSVTHR